MTKRDPLCLERKRQLFAAKGQINKLKETYSAGFDPKVDLNTPTFWDKKIKEGGLSVYSQDKMTRDRISTVLSYIPESCRALLDIGIGAGYLEQMLVKNRKDIKFRGVDISPFAIKRLRRLFKGEFVIGDILKLPFKDNLFDVVVALEVLEHLPPSRVFKALKEIKSVSHRDGIIIISVPLNEGILSFEDNPSGHLREYTKELILAEVEIAGLEVVESKELYAFETMYELRNILKHFMPKRWKPNNIVLKIKQK